MAKRVSLSRKAVKYENKEDRQKVRDQLAALEEKLTSLLNGVEADIRENLHRLSQNPSELARMLRQFEASEENWSMPKNLMCALLMEEVRQYGPMGLRMTVSTVSDSSREAKRNTREIRNWYHRI